MHFRQPVVAVFTVASSECLVCVTGQPVVAVFTAASSECLVCVTGQPVVAVFTAASSECLVCVSQWWRGAWRTRATYMDEYRCSSD